MRSSSTLLLAVVLCVASLFLHQVHSRPYDALTEKDRQEIVHYAAKILKIAFGGEEYAFSNNGQEKRNSGMLDAVINMPDLFKAGRK